MIDMPCRIFTPVKGETGLDQESLLSREWIVTNGLGGYASGTVGGVNTWRYHGLLTSAIPAPLGRMMMLEQLFEQIRFRDGRVFSISGEERRAGTLIMPSTDYLVEFRVEAGLPMWRYKIDTLEFTKSVVMSYRQNTTYVTYHVLAAEGPVQFELRPFVSFRRHEASFEQIVDQHAYLLSAKGHRYEISARADLPVLRMSLQAEHFTLVTDGGAPREAFFRKDAERGYDARGIGWTPGYFSVEVTAGHDIVLTASTESWDNIHAMRPQEAVMLEHERRRRLLEQAPASVQTGIEAELVLAGDQFIIEPVGRFRERIRALATGERVRAIIAGYHWFTDWGRDTMISLEGLTLLTGRAHDARAILTALNRYLRDGLLPNLFPEGAEDGLYHTADATLWYFHAIDRYLEYTDDRSLLKILLPGLIHIAEQHLTGTRFGIRVDSKDGLLMQGEEGYQLTWMDAKVGDWVVTPRRGKAVEINSLWYNAMRLLAKWLSEEGEEKQARSWLEHAERTHASFNERFWYEEGGYLYDVIDGEMGNDAALRPNQLFSFTLRYPVLSHERWETVLKKVEQALLTPRGLRTLAPDHPDYKPEYFGDLRARDAAYHQGTVWPWLIGPFIDAWLAVHPEDQSRARKFLDGLIPHLDEAAVGSVSEICDAESPFTPRGCISQAWSVAEVLRTLVKTSKVEEEKEEEVVAESSPRPLVGEGLEQQSVIS